MLSGNLEGEFKKKKKRTYHEEINLLLLKQQDPCTAPHTRIRTHCELAFPPLARRA